MYISYSFNKQLGTYIFNNRISEELFISILNAVKYIQIIANDIDYWCLIDHNILKMKEIIKDYRSCRPELFVEINGAFANILSSYYLWKCHNQHEHNSAFKSIQKEFREVYIECYLISELRNYLAHDGFAISRTTYDVLNEVVHFYVNPQDLIDSMSRAKHKPNATLKKYLQKMITEGEKIDIIPFIDKFREIYSKIQTKLWEQNESEVKHALQKVFLVVPQKDPDLYNSYIRSEDGERYLNIGHPLYHFLYKTQRYYPKYLEL